MSTVWYSDHCYVEEGDKSLTRDEALAFLLDLALSLLQNGANQISYCKTSNVPFLIVSVSEGETSVRLPCSSIEESILFILRVLKSIAEDSYSGLIPPISEA